MTCGGVETGQGSHEGWEASGAEGSGWGAGCDWDEESGWGEDSGWEGS